MWLGGQKPCADDNLAVNEIKAAAAPPRAETHPNAFAWWSFASKFTDAIRNTWTGKAKIPCPQPREEEKKEPVSIPNGQPVADPVYSMMFD